VTPLDTITAMAEARTPAPTRVAVSDNLIKLILLVFLVPAPFELIVGAVKREQYDPTRLAIIVGALVVLSVVLAVLRGRQVRVQAIVGYYLLAAGVVLAAFGIAATFRPDLLLRADVKPIVTTISALAPTMGVLLLASGAYLIREQVRRIRDELDLPGPYNVASPRTIRLDGGNLSIWRADSFPQRPGAQTVVDICLPYVSPVDLHYVAYYTREGECVFYVDCLDDDTMAHYDVPDTPDRRRQYEQQGRHLRHVATRLDRRFTGLESGPIVRLVVDVKKGALFLYILEAEGFLVGVTLDQRQVDLADQKLSELANRILIARGGMGTQDFSVRQRPAAE
jgi:hypothetical protein